MMTVREEHHFVHKITTCISKLVLMKFDLCVPKLTTKCYSLFIGKAEMGEEELIQMPGQFSGLYSDTTVQTVKIGTFLKCKRTFIENYICP
jgi:hypothetical protein